MVERSLAGVHGNAVPARRARVAARVPSAPASSTTRASPAAMRAAAASSTRIGVSPPVAWTRRRAGETSSAEPVGDQRGEIVVWPRADRHQVEHVDPGQQTATRVGVGRPRRGGDEGERLRGSGVVVVAVGDLTDPDDDGDGCRHAVSMARSPLAGIPGSLTLTRSHRRRAP